jgi:hypothetical protein
MQYVDAIQGITHAYARGDGASPTVKGVVHDAWGLTLTESGNILVSGGVAYNMLFTEEAGVAGYNLDVTVKKEQEFEAVTRLIVEGEAGFDEVFDEAGVGIRGAGPVGPAPYLKLWRMCGEAKADQTPYTDRHGREDQGGRVGPRGIRFL